MSLYSITHFSLRLYDIKYKIRIKKKKKISSEFKIIRLLVIVFPQVSLDWKKLSFYNNNFFLQKTIFITLNCLFKWLGTIDSMDKLSRKKHIFIWIVKK